MKTGVQCFCNTVKSLDSGFHRNDDSWAFSTFYEVARFESFEKYHHFAQEICTLKRIDQISGLIILLLAVFYLFKTTKLAIWKGTTLGPGFFPLILSIALVALTILLLVKATLATKEHSLSLPKGFFPSRSGLLKLIYLTGALVVYVLTLQPLGYLLSTLLFLCVLFLAWDPKKPGLAIVVAVGTVLCSYVFFNLLLKVQLPKGLLG